MNYLVITIIYLIVIIGAAIIPNPIKGEGINYVLHSIEFFIFSALIFLTATHYKKKSPYILAIGISFISVIFIETIQSFISYRTFNLIDILAGILGSLLILIKKTG